MFSCSNNYFPDDLERIPCLVCKALGHVCCANISNEEGPSSISCYSCGQSGHQGPECMKLHDNSKGTERTLLDHKNGDEVSKAKKRKKHKKAKEVGATSLGIVSEEEEDITKVKLAPRMYGGVPRKKIRQKYRQMRQKVGLRGG